MTAFIICVCVFVIVQAAYNWVTYRRCSHGFESEAGKLAKSETAWFSPHCVKVEIAEQVA